MFRGVPLVCSVRSPRRNESLLKRDNLILWRVSTDVVDYYCGEYPPMLYLIIELLSSLNCYDD